MMSAAKLLMVTASLSAGDEPLRCTDLDMAQVSVISGRVERQVVTRDQASGWSPFQDIWYDIVVTVRPLRTLRGTAVTRPVTVRVGCTTPWMDFAGRRSCSNLLAEGEVDTFSVDRRTYNGNRNPDRDEVADYDRQMSRPLARCERQ